jgi:hypothetical protein
MHQTTEPTAGTVAPCEVEGAQIFSGLEPKIWGMYIWMRPKWDGSAVENTLAA